jgi:hypothetical protein
MPVSRRWRPRDLSQVWCPLAAGSAGPGRSQPGAIAAIRRPGLSRASCSLAVRSNAWLTCSGTGHRSGKATLHRLQRMPLAPRWRTASAMQTCERQV